jgi:hypothetical protein
MCVDVGPMPVCVGPGEEKVLTVNYDPADDPEFSGRLSVEVVGTDEAGRAAFLTHVEFEVTAAGHAAAPAQRKSGRDHP